jgi:hypothetical protein
LPVAVEVELSVKSPRRLANICRAWARCRCVAGTLYLVSPGVGQAVERAVEETGATERIVVVGLHALPRGAAVACQEPSQETRRLSARGSISY